MRERAEAVRETVDRGSTLREKTVDGPVGAEGGRGRSPRIRAERRAVRVSLTTDDDEECVDVRVNAVPSSSSSSPSAFLRRRRGRTRGPAAKPVVRTRRRPPLLPLPPFSPPSFPATARPFPVPSPPAAGGAVRGAELLTRRASFGATFSAILRPHPFSSTTPLFRLDLLRFFRLQKTVPKTVPITMIATRMLMEMMMGTA